MKITDLSGLFNIKPNPEHDDWLDVSFKEDFCIPDIKTNFCNYKCLKIELENEYEELFLEGAFKNNIDYDIHFGTNIVSDKERILNMYYSTYDAIHKGHIVPANEIHTHLYMAYKLKNNEEIKRYGNFIIISNKGKIESIEEKIEIPNNKRYLKVNING